jgi:hypothetical protein
MCARVLALLLIAGQAVAAQKLAITPLGGDKGHAVERQLSSALCKRLTCAPHTKVMKGAKPDFARAKKAGINALLIGHIAGGHAEVTVVFPDQPKIPVFSQTYAVVRGKLSKNDLLALTEGVVGALGGAPVPPPPAAPEPAAPTPPIAPEPVAEKTPPAPEPATPLPEERAAPSSRETGSQSTEVVVEEHPIRPAAKNWPIIQADVGLDIVGRSFDYNNLTQGNALRYSAPGIFSPRLDLELCPMAHSISGFAGRWGISADGTYAVGLQSQLGTAPAHPTSLSRFDGGLLWWLGNPTGLSFAPEAGYRLLSFSTSAAKDGSVLTGLPNVTYGALRFSGALRFAASEKIRIDLRLSGMPVLGAADLIGPNYFTKGSGLGLEGEAGVRILIAKQVGIGIFGEYTRYSFSFNSTGAYQANGATDQYYGGRAAATFVY